MGRRGRWPGLWLLMLTALSARGTEPAGAVGDAPSPAAPGTSAATAEGLRMTPAVACQTIDGYEAFDPLPDAALTADEKLLVYYRPLGYRVVRGEKDFRSHLTQ